MNKWTALTYLFGLVPLVGLFLLAQASYGGVCVPWTWRVVIGVSHISFGIALYAALRVDPDE